MVKSRAGLGRGCHRPCAGKQEAEPRGLITGRGPLPFSSLFSFNASTSASHLEPLPVPFALFSVTGCLGDEEESKGLL